MIMKRTVFLILMCVLLLGCSGGVFADAVVYDWEVERYCDYDAYVSTVDGGVNLREEPSVDGKIICKISDFVCLNITQETTDGWGYTSYDGYYGWVALSQLSMDYPITSVNQMVKVTASDGVNLREGPYTSYAKITAIPYGKVLKVTGISENNWGQVSYNGQSGWIAMNQVSEASKSNLSDGDNAADPIEEDLEPAEDDAASVDEVQEPIGTVTAEEPESSFPVAVLVIGIILIIVVIAAVLIVVLVSKKV